MYLLEQKKLKAFNDASDLYIFRTWKNATALKYVR